MIIINKNLVIILLFVLLVACGSVPDTHYYSLSYPPVDSSTTPPKLNKIVGVKKFIADPPYDQDRLVYRDSPYEIKFYNYRRWICSPREMLTENAVLHLRASGLFAGVAHAHNSQSFDYLLGGRVLQFEEWDETNRWQARVKLWLELQSTSSRKVVWQGYVESQVPVDEKQPLNVVKALSRAADDCFKQLVGKLSENLEP